MTTAQKISRAEQSIQELKQVLSEVEQDLHQQRKAYHRQNGELSRKVVARMLGCTPDHVSWLKRKGRLKSYRYEDVQTYLKNH